MSERGRHYRRWLALALLVFLCDQISKWIILQTIPPVRQLTPFFNLVLTFNEGGAFSLFRDGGGWQRHFFLLVGGAVTTALLLWLWRLPLQERLNAAALALIIGGAWGNLLDRLRLGAVIDFLDVHLGGWHWPAFNLADSAICIGALLMVTQGWPFLRNRSAVNAESS